MAAISYKRGNKIIFDGERWRYMDDNSIANYEKPCGRCGKLPNADGTDACIGRIEGAISVCCGHGIEKPYCILAENSNQ